MRHVDVIDPADLMIFTRSLGSVNPYKQKHEKENTDQVKILSDSFTTIRNAFEMVRTYSQNILSIQKSVIESEKRNERENVVENLYDNKPQDALTSGIIKRFPDITKTIKDLQGKLQDSKLVSQKSVIDYVTDGMSSIAPAILAGGAAIGGAMLAFGSNEEQHQQEEDDKQFSSTQTLKPTKENKQFELRPRPNNTATTNRYEEIVKKQVSAEKKSNFITSAYVAEEMRNASAKRLVLGQAPSTSSNIIQQFYDLADQYNNVMGAGSSENASLALNYFINKGWTREQAAGIVGNLQAESGPNINPSALNRAGGGLGARGIAQWRGDRIRQFQKLYGTTPDRAPLQQQLDYVQWELSNSEKKAGTELKRASTAEEAAIIFERYYERAGHAIQKRIANARALLKTGQQTFGQGIDVISTHGNTLLRQSLDQVNDGTLNVPADVSQYIRLNGNVNMKGLHPTVFRRFSAMAMEYFQRTGKKIQVNSAFRTYAEQVALFARLGPGKAARPGRSRHESGLAIDIQSADANKLAELGLLGKYKFHRPLGHEKWHLEPIEGRAVPGSSVEENTGSDQQAMAAIKEASLDSKRRKMPAMSESRTISRNQQTAAFERSLFPQSPLAPVTKRKPLQTTTRPPAKKTTNPSSIQQFLSYFTK